MISTQIRFLVFIRYDYRTKLPLPSLIRGRNTLVKYADFKTVNLHICGLHDLRPVQLIVYQPIARGSLEAFEPDRYIDICFI